MKSLAFLLLFFGCSKDEPKYTKDQLFDLSRAADSSTALVLPKSMSEGVNCSDYTDGCLSAHIVKVRSLELIAVEFQSTEQANYAAKKFRGYYVRNWLLDDVRGEPILEKFVEEHLEAKKP
jgi:hypothetical protein